MAREGYGGLTVPTDIIDDIDSIINTDKVRFRSRTDVVKEAINEFKLKILDGGNQNE